MGKVSKPTFVYHNKNIEHTRFIKDEIMNRDNIESIIEKLRELIRQ